uniref:Uncharacterized protein n=2 Tax=Palpitomonas bilix TaxID=652834 RepID=A0A7S3GFC4_9EUKA|mmetsp:Transcript_47011/g.121374  ORF Transcript_47011/g.121374 Transcript_47011/m.121374 type:complete len:233 (+) Transcript_47011:72-770(+)
MNIIFGIIIDTFGELRSRRDEIKNDIYGTCFICALESSVFERKSTTGDFFYHVKYEHHMWDYLAFIVYLQEKPETEYTGMESYVSQLMTNRDQSWVPNNRALCLPEEEDDHDNDIKEIKKKLEKLEGFMGNFSRKMTKTGSKKASRVDSGFLGDPQGGSKSFARLGAQESFAMRRGSTDGDEAAAAAAAAAAGQGRLLRSVEQRLAALDELMEDLPTLKSVLEAVEALKEAK